MNFITSSRPAGSSVCPLQTVGPPQMPQGHEPVPHDSSLSKDLCLSNCPTRSGSQRTLMTLRYHCKKKERELFILKIISDLPESFKDSAGLLPAASSHVHILHHHIHHSWDINRDVYCWPNYRSKPDDASFLLLSLSWATRVPLCAHQTL